VDLKRGSWSLANVKPKADDIEVPPMLACSDVTKKFGGLVALSSVSFNVEVGELVGLIGPNGSGKTTLFNVVSGVYKPERGSIFFKEKQIVGLRPFRIHRLGIARTFQLVRPFLELRAYDNVKLGLMFGTGRHELFGQNPMRLLEVVGLEKSADSPAMNLNTNDRKKLELARALASEPELLLLDEIITGLNPVETDEFVALIREIKQQYVKTIVMVEHIMKVVMKISDRVLVLHHGQLIAQGKPAEVSQNEEVIGAYLGEKRKSV